MTSITLFPDQVKWEDDLRAAYASGAKSVLGVAPTGFGKTVCFSDMARSAVERGKSVGIFVHRKELVGQIGAALNSFGVQHGYLAPDFPPNPLAMVQVCSVQTMGKRIERLLARPFGLCVIDEAHHAAQGTAWHAIVNAHTPHPSRPQSAASRVLGVTATPIRLSGEPLSIAFDRMVLGPTTADLIAWGRLSRYRLYAPAAPDMSGVGKRAGDFVREQNTGIMDKPTVTGDAVTHYKRLAMGKRAVAFCTSVGHAEHVAEQFRTEGISSASLDGTLDKTTRRNRLAAFERGEIMVLTSCELISEGYDVPAIECIIMLRPTQSLALFLQQVGRGLRVFPGKEYAIILDHAGNTRNKEDGGRGHGLPDDPRNWILGENAQKAASFSLRGRPTITCGSCWATFGPAACCPYCGFERDIKGRQISQIDGELVEVDPNLVREARRVEQDTKNRELIAARTLPDVARFAVKHGHNAGWIFNRFKHMERGRKDLTFGEAVKALKKAQKEVENVGA